MTETKQVEEQKRERRLKREIGTNACKKSFKTNRRNRS
jgi:hypothetical protein